MSKAFSLIFLLVIFIIVLVTILFKPNTQNVFYSWQEIGPDNSRIIRVITSQKSCPNLTIDHQSQSMTLRAKADPSSPVITCEKTVRNTQTISVDQITFSPLPTHPKKILVIGDTGCRLKGADIQNCDNALEWPLSQLAKSAANMNPDLIIHVGDNLYRQDPCPTVDPGCQGSPSGNNWQTWEADFFSPIAPLLNQAPWVIVRGNHETCSRAGLLWFEYLAPQPFTGKCQPFTDPYLINFENLQLLNIDSAGASDFDVNLNDLDLYKQTFEFLPKLSKHTWLITHRPFWGIKALSDQEEEDQTEKISGEKESYLLHYIDGSSPKQPLVRFNHTLQDSLNPQLLSSLQLILSGHYHNFETINFDGKIPPQLIVGNSGTKLEEEITDKLTGLIINNHQITQSSYLHQFGFMIMEEQSENSWLGSLYNPSGQEILKCTVKDRNINCN